MSNPTLCSDHPCLCIAFNYMNQTILTSCGNNIRYHTHLLLAESVDILHENCAFYVGYGTPIVVDFYECLGA